MRTYILHWPDGINEVASGNHIVDALGRNGYGPAHYRELESFEDITNRVRAKARAAKKQGTGGPAGRNP